MTQQYDFAVFIGRFQPFHNAHAEVVKHGLSIAKKVIMLVGSSNRPRSLRNPWTFDERAAMIDMWWTGVLGEGGDLDGLGCDCSDLIIAPLPDAAYDDAEWVTHVQAAVRNATARHVQPKIALIGSDKDNSTYYLRLFPQWSFEPATGTRSISATGVRESYFEHASLMKVVEGRVPSEVFDFLTMWRGKPEWKELLDERAFIRKYRAEWGNGPFMAVDAVVVQSGHVLLIERGQPPGVGKLALPGGFLNADETMLQGSLRELKEETGLDLPIEMASLFLKAHHVFDDPFRSARARMLTGAFLFELPPGQLPRVQGGDDAASARWVELADLRTDTMFADHAFIIRHLLNKAKG